MAAIRHQVALLVEAEQVLSHADLASGEQIGVKILDGQINALEAELERYRNLKFGCIRISAMMLSARKSTVR